jgi:hypothetical protein
MSVMTAGKATEPAGTVIPLRPRRGGADRHPRARVPQAARLHAGASPAGVLPPGVRGRTPRARVPAREVPWAHVPQGGVPHGGVPRAGVPRARAMRPPGSRPALRARTVRLTRRGRIVVAVLLTAAALLVAVPLWLAAASRAQATSGGSPAGAVYQNLTPVVVHPGESLWSIALRAEPSADPRIVELNALGGTGIEPGERLWVPRG